MAGSPILRLEASPTLVGPGDLVMIVATIINTTDQAITGTVFTDDIPAGFAFQPAESRDVEQSHGEVTAFLGSIEPHSSTSLTYALRVQGPGQFENTWVTNAARVTGGGVTALAGVDFIVVPPGKSGGVVGKAGGALKSASGRLTARIPAGAFGGPRAVLLDPETNATSQGYLTRLQVLAPVGETLDASGNPVDAELELIPSEAAFAEPVALEFGLDGIADVQNLAADQVPYVVTLDDASGTWVRVQNVGIDPALNALVVETTHFSQWGVGVGPNEQMMLFDNPGPSLFTGTTRFGFPIWTPPGPGGLQPSLSLSYSSSTVDGAVQDIQAPWTGLGWSLSTIEIDRDITNGSCVPCGSGSFGYRNDFLLLFNGTGYQLVQDTDPVHPERYYTEVHSFLSIIRHSPALYNGGTPQNETNEWWEVITQDGTVYRLGYTQDSEQLANMKGYAVTGLTPNGAWASLGYAGQSADRVASRWKVDQITDVNGNVVSFSYQEFARVISGLSPKTFDLSSYLASVSYACSRDGNGNCTDYNYRVIFDHTLRSSDLPENAALNDWSQWEDQQLSAVRVQYKAGAEWQDVRRYLLDYEMHTSAPDDGKTWDSLVLTGITEQGVAADGGTLNLPRTGFRYTDFDGRGACGAGCQEWAYPRLVEITNGYGGKVTYEYENDGRSSSAYWYSWRVKTVYVDDGLSTVPMKTTYAYARPRYTGGYTANYPFLAWGGAIVQYDSATCDPHPANPLQGAICGDGEPHFTGDPYCIPLGQWPCEDGERYDIQAPAWYYTTSDTGGDLLGYGEVSESAWGFDGQRLAATVHEFHTRSGPLPPVGRTYSYVLPPHTPFTPLAGHEYDTLYQDGSGITLRETKTNYVDYADVLSNRRVHFVYASKIENSVWDGGQLAPTTTTVSQYDLTNGQPSLVQELVGGSLYRQTRYVYLPPTANGISGKVRSVTMEDGSGSPLSRTYYAYDGTSSSIIDGGLLTLQQAVITFSPSESTADTSYTYDAAGNVITVTDPNGSQSSTVYDSRAIYPVRATNALGQSAVTDYDPRLGLPMSVTDLLAVTDPITVTTYAEYDALGRLTKVIRPGDSTYWPTARYVYHDDVTPASIETELREQSGCGECVQTAITYYDGLGRLIQASAEAAGGQWTVTRTVYDALRRGWRSYLSTFAGSSAYSAPPTWSTSLGAETLYDALGRIVQVINPDSTSVRSAYLGLKTGVLDANGHQRISQADNFGRTVAVMEYDTTQSSINFGQSPTATTTYAYDRLNRLTSVTDAANPGHTTQIFYDDLGRKTRMVDPDMGTWNYQYDAGGRLIAQIDAKGQATNLYYDDLNRLLGKTYDPGPVNPANYQRPLDPGFTGYVVKFYFDSTASDNFGIGHRTQMVDPTGSASWTYDDRGRLISESKIITGIPDTFVTGYAYDAQDRAVDITYPSGEVVHQDYNSGGQLSGVIGPGAGVYTSTVQASGLTYNERGQLTGLTLGQGVGAITTAYDYNAASGGAGNAFRLGRISTSANGSTLFELRYTYDNVGNIRSILDEANGWQTLNFTYDALDRLKTAGTTAAGEGQYSVAYDYTAIGNISSVNWSSPVPTGQPGGTYTYDAIHPHAVASVGGNSYSYDANGNMITRTEVVSDTATTYAQHFDVENRLDVVTSTVLSDVVTVTRFYYDGDGQRVKQEVDSGSAVTSTFYIGNIYEVSSTTGSVAPTAVPTTMRTPTAPAPIPTPTATVTDTPAASATPTLTPTPQPLLAGLVSYWNLDQASGTRSDSMGANHLTPAAALASSPGLLGNAVSLSGASDNYLSIGDNASLRTYGTSFTITAWVNDPDIAAGEHLIGRVNASVSAYSEYYLEVLADGKIRFYVMDSSNWVYVDSAQSISPGTWNFIAAWYDTDANVQYVQVNQGSIASAANVNGPPNQSNAFYIGRRGDGSAGRYSGLVDSVSFWKRALPPLERAALYNNGIGTEYPFAGWSSATLTPVPTITPTLTATPGPSSTFTRTPRPTNTPTWTPTLAGYTVLTLQPDSTMGQDNWINNAGATTNYGTHTQLSIGEYDQATNDVRRGLLRFDLTLIPVTATVRSATLSLWLVNDHASNAGTFRVYRLLQSWTESGSTWDNYASGQAWQEMGAGGALDRESTDIGSLALAESETSGSEKKWTLDKDKVQEWVANPSSNLGMLVKTEAETDDLYDFNSSDFGTASQRPKLVIEYTIPPGTPTPAPTPPYTATPTATATPNANGLLNGLVAYWNLNEASGTRFDELNGCGGSGCDLTDNNTVSQVTGKLGNAGQFTATDFEWLSRADHADLSRGNTSFSIQAWVYLDSKPTEGDIVGKFSSVAGQREWLLSYNGALDRFLFYVTSTGGAASYVAADSLGSPALNTWYHIVATHDAFNDQACIYVNNNAGNCMAWSAGIYDSTSNLTVGKQDGASNGYFDGRTDEIGLWSKALTSSERAALYSTGNGCGYDFGGCFVALTATPTPTPSRTPSPTITWTPTQTETVTPSPAPGGSVTVNLQPSGFTGQDADLSAKDPDANYGSSLAINVGESYAGVISDVHRSLIKFDLSSLPAGARITSATLNLWMTSDNSNFARTLSVYALTRPWAETGAAWNTSGLGAWGAPGAFDTNSDIEATAIGSRAMAASEAVGWKAWTLYTESAQGWLDNPSSNYGLLLRVDAETDDQYAFASSDHPTAAYWPKLTITYNLATSTPTQTRTPAPTPAGLATLIVQAYIDGRSQLVVQNNTVRWYHINFAAPGREAGNNAPTYLNDVAWYPWPGSGEYRDCNCYSSTYTGVPNLLAQTQIVSAQVIAARQSLSIVQQPAAGNNYTLVVDFNDNDVGSSAWYQVKLTYINFIPTATPTVNATATSTGTPTWTPTATPHGPATVSFQPDATNGQDALIYNVAATTNYGTNAVIEAGEYNAASNDIRRTVLRFDLSSIPANAIVQGATLSLWVSGDYANNARTYRIYRLKRAFAESYVTWNNYGNGLPWQIAGAGGSHDVEASEIGSLLLSAAEPVGTEEQWTLNAAKVQEWIVNPAGNYGLLLKAETESDDLYDFASSDHATASWRPKLTITYYIPTSTPTSPATATRTDVPTWTPTVMRTATATSTSTSTATPVPTATPAPSGYYSPSAQAAQTGGDGNGFETNPANAFSDNAAFAVDKNSGTNTSTSCTDASKDKHRFYNYNIALPAGSTINGIQVRLDAKVDSATGAPKMCVQLSWDGGASWTPAQTSATLTTAEATYLLGGASESWGRVWTSSEFGNANFLLRVIDLASNTSRDFSLDWAAVQVYYTAPTATPTATAPPPPPAARAISYYYAGASRFAMRVVDGANNQVYYLQGDHLGSTSLVVDDAGQVLARQWYYPYGGVRASSGTLPTDFGYTGQRLDASTGGLMFYNARYYAPYLNRWIQPDTIIPNPGNPQSLNRFSYVLNSPLNYTDPSGQWECVDTDDNGRCVADTKRQTSKAGTRKADRVPLTESGQDMLGFCVNYYDGSCTMGNAKDLLERVLEREFSDLPLEGDDVHIQLLTHATTHSVYMACEGAKGEGYLQPCSGISLNALLNWLGGFSQVAKNMMYEGGPVPTVIHSPAQQVASGIFQPANPEWTQSSLIDDQPGSWGNASLYKIPKPGFTGEFLTIEEFLSNQGLGAPPWAWGMGDRFYILTVEQARALQPYWVGIGNR